MKEIERSLRRRTTHDHAQRAFVRGSNSKGGHQLIKYAGWDCEHRSEEKTATCNGKGETLGELQRRKEARSRNCIKVRH